MMFIDAIHIHAEKTRKNEINFNLYTNRNVGFRLNIGPDS
jgi:hypothetical protein